MGKARRRSSFISRKCLARCLRRTKARAMKAPAARRVQNVTAKTISLTVGMFPPRPNHITKCGRVKYDITSIMAKSSYMEGSGPRVSAQHKGAVFCHASDGVGSIRRGTSYWLPSGFPDSVRALRGSVNPEPGTISNVHPCHSRTYARKGNV